MGAVSATPGLSTPRQPRQSNEVSGCMGADRRLRQVEMRQVSVSPDDVDRPAASWSGRESRIAYCRRRDIVPIAFASASPGGGWTVARCCRLWRRAAGSHAWGVDRMLGSFCDRQMERVQCPLPMHDACVLYLVHTARPDPTKLSRRVVQWYFSYLINVRSNSELETTVITHYALGVLNDHAIYKSTHSLTECGKFRPTCCSPVTKCVAIDNARRRCASYKRSLTASFPFPVSFLSVSV